MNVLIVDDEPLARARIARLVTKLRPDFNILPLAASANEALNICESTVPDLALLDIEMPGMSGVELAKRLKVSEPPPAIIFITAYPDRALSAFSVTPQGYLVKPVSETDLDNCLNTLKTAHRAQSALSQQESLAYQEKGVEKFIALSDIRLIRTEEKYLRVYTQSSSMLIDGSLKQLLQVHSRYLIRVHRNTVINKAYIEEIGHDANKYFVRLFDYDNKIDVSRREWSSLKAHLQN